jgi:hypothetical protein
LWIAEGVAKVNGVLDDVHLVSRVGKMLIAASEMTTARFRLGPSMMNASLTRLSVRNPVPLCTTELCTPRGPHRLAMQLLRHSKGL